MDFNTTVDVPWLHIENGSGLELEEKELTLTCDPSTLTSIRKGKVIIKSGITNYEISVVQSAAGGDLEPFISIVGGNYLLTDGRVGTIDIEVQSNVPYSVSSDVEWLSPAQTLSRMAVPKITNLVFNKLENSDGVLRTGNIIIENKEYNLKTVLTIEQKLSSLLLAHWAFPKEENLVLGEDYQEMPVVWYKSDNKKAELSAVIAEPNTSKKHTYYNDKEYQRILAYGVNLNDYWLFEMPVKDTPAGNLNINYYTASSATGPKFFTIEWSLDGSTWTPVNTKTANFKYGDGGKTPSEGYVDVSRDITYTYYVKSSSSSLKDLTFVDETFALPSISGENTLSIRARVSDVMNAGMYKDIYAKHVGTHRMIKEVSITLTAE